MITPGYDPSHLAPKILIHDLDGTLQYTYEAEQIAASPTQDFQLRSLNIHIGINDDIGSTSFLIEDPNNALTETTARSDSKIKRQWTVQISLGKSSADLNRWFYGKIIDVEVIRLNTAVQQIRVAVLGWGVRLRERMTNIRRFQKKNDSDGTTLDATDTDARISEIVKDVVQDTDHYLDLGQGTESEITVNGVQTIDIKLADFQQAGNTWAAAISQLAAEGAAHWGLDGDRDLFLIKPMSSNGGFLFTNDLAGLDGQGWDAKKIGYLRRTPIEWNDSSFGSAYSVIHGLGANTHVKVIDRNPTPDSTFDISTNWIAVEVPTLDADNLEKVSASLNKNGTPSGEGDLNVFVCGEDGSGKPALGTNLRAAGLLHSTKLDAIPASGRGWTEIGFRIPGGIPTASEEKLYVVFKKFGTGTNGIVWERDTAGTDNFYTSADGTDGSWSAASTDQFLLRMYANYPINITLEDVSAKNKYGTRELVFAFRQSIQEETAREALIAASEVLSQELRTYSNVIVSPFTDRLPIGKTCKIQDLKSGLDIEADVVGIDVSMMADNRTNIGADEIVLTLQESHL